MIVVQVYNRPEHAIRVFESLRANNVRSFWVSFDKALDQSSITAQSEILKYLNKHKSLDIERFFHEKRLGLAKTYTNTVTAVLRKSENVIFLEDDCVVRPGGIQYFVDGLNSLKKNEKIRTICGYTYPLDNIYWGSNQNLMYAKRFSSWGWATWRDRWTEYTSDLRSLVLRIVANGITLDSIGADIERMLSKDKYLNGNKDIWSLPWTLLHFLTDTYAVFPRESFIDNIGFDGSGINCSPTSVFENVSGVGSLNVRYWTNVVYYLQNEQAIKKFMDENSHNIF